MEKQIKKIDPEKYYFSDTSFNLLMQRRIRKVLLICSSYDAFMLEEDGRIDEQIFNEYVSLNLRYPPVFIHTDSAKKAFEIVDKEDIDLIIEMLSVGDIDTFALAHKFKILHPQIPIVVLTHFSREVSLKLENEDLTAIDYVFCWLGNADLLLAIIKLIEDKMNVQYDVENVGVQTIILVEDSIRFVSMYLPHLYKIVLLQTQEYIKEALNEHQKMLRRRGRPKILLATNYEEAVHLYNKYKNNLLGIISDISYREAPDDKQKMTNAGIELCKLIKKEDPNIPVLLQSSDYSKKEIAERLNAGFIHKYSKNISNEIRDYVIRYFGFGDFIFRNPKTMEVDSVASDLRTMQELILSIPDETLEYHTKRDDFSKWLKARALFPIAEMLKVLKLDDFSGLDEARKYLYKALGSFRASKGLGIIAEFDKDRFDEYMVFSRIGEGSIGGKARGLAFINSILKKYDLQNKFEDVLITIPKTVVLSTDIFDEFMESNNLYKLALSDKSDDEKILQAFVNAYLPERILQDLYTFISYVDKPIAIRSSSKLEDSHYQPFAGIYTTYMIPVSKKYKDESINLLSDAIKCVYASVYFQSSKAYISATSNVIDEEKMGIIIQEVCGHQKDNYYYPTISGVARSINFYPIEPEKSEEGIVNIAYGLGKYIMDGENTLRFSPKYPDKILQLSSPTQALNTTQNKFYALDLSPESFIPSTNDGINIKSLRLKVAEKDECLKYVASTYDFENEVIRDSTMIRGKRVLTFSNILQHDVFPLALIIQDLLKLGQKEMNNPIEIEFAIDFNVPRGYPVIFNFLQIRPVVERNLPLSFNLENIDITETVLFSNMALGNGIFENIADIVYVKTEAFDPSQNKEIAKQVHQMNELLKRENKNYVLIGPGRWGSKDPWLGIPIVWTQISEARVIVEYGLDNYRVEPSQGTHFFHNLTSFRVGYFTINPYINDGFIDEEYLAGQKPLYEDEFIRHVRFDKTLVIQVDGKTNKGVIYK